MLERDLAKHGLGFLQFEQLLRLVETKNSSKVFDSERYSVTITSGVVPAQLEMIFEIS